MDFEFLKELRVIPVGNVASATGTIYTAATESSKHKHLLACVEKGLVTEEQKEAMCYYTNPEMDVQKSFFGPMLDRFCSPVAVMSVSVLASVALFFIPPFGITFAAIYFSISVMLEIFALCKSTKRYMDLRQLQIDAQIMTEKLVEIGETPPIMTDKPEISRSSARFQAVVESLPSLGLSIASAVCTGNPIGGAISSAAWVLGMTQHGNNEVAWKEERNKLEQFNNDAYKILRSYYLQQPVQEETLQYNIPFYKPGCLGVKPEKGFGGSMVHLLKKGISYSEHMKEFTPQLVTQEVTNSIQKHKDKPQNPSGRH